MYQLTNEEMKGTWVEGMREGAVPPGFDRTEAEATLNAAWDEWLNGLKADVWDAGYRAGQGSMLHSAGGEPLTNPYRGTE